MRKQVQVDLLTKLGAKFVVNFSSESFKKDLYKAIDRGSIRMALWITAGAHFFR